MDFYIFNSSEALLYIRNDADEAIHEERDYLLTATFPVDADRPITRGMYIGFYDLDGAFQFFEIRDATTSEPDATVSIEAESAALSELLDEVIEDKRPTSKQAGAAVSDALLGSRWELGAEDSSSNASAVFYYTSRWDALQTIVTTWGVALRFRWTVGSAGITGRYVDVLSRAGAARGKRFELDKDIAGIKVSYDDRNVYTALYGRGKGVEVGTDGSGDPTYGRRLTFADIVWTTAGGDPANKPAGQEWVEDVGATEDYGRAGRPRVGVVEFSNCTDAAELLTLTWAKLQEVKAPKLTIKATVEDMEAVWGYTHEAVRWGDDVAVIISGTANVQIYASVSDLARNLLHPEKTKITIGNYRDDITDVQAATQEAIQSATLAASIGANLARTNPGLVSAVIDTMITRIISSGTTRYTDTDGADVLETADGTRAYKAAGAGLLLANAKIGGVWQWRTAITGDGIVADEVTTGTLRAGIVFAGTLQGVLGTFETLIAGDPTKAHMTQGTDENGDPFIRMHDNSGVLQQTFYKLGTLFSNGTDMKMYTIETRTGIGIF